MKYLSQRDPQWADRKLGASTLLMRNYGCTTTCLSMLSDYFGCYKAPSEVASNVNNYTKEGLIIWQNLKFDKMTFVKRTYVHSAPEVKEAMKNKDKAVILQVDNFHWVVGVKPTLVGDDYVVIDSWDGKKKNLKSAYKKVTGAAFFTRT